MCKLLLCGSPQVNFTNRFHLAVRLFSNRSQMTSKCGKNKRLAHEAIAECVIDVLTTFWRLLWSITEQTHGNMESIFCMINKQTTTENAFYFKIFQHNSKARLDFQLVWESGCLSERGLTKRLEIKPTRKPAFSHFGKHAISRNLLSIQNENISLVAMRSKELLLRSERAPT